MPRKAKGKQVRDETGRLVAVRGRAANGEGSVYAVDNGSRWRATWRDHTGKLRVLSARTRDLAMARRAEAIAADQQGATIDRTTTVADLAHWWVDNVAAMRVRPSTLAKYSDRADRIDATLGHHRIAELRPQHGTEWQTSELAAGQAPKSVINTRQVLRQTIAAAVDLGLITTNVVDKVAAPKRPASTARALTTSEARAIVAAAIDDRLGAAVAILFVQGWRASEVLGLAWGDIDTTAGTATVRRAAVYIDGQGSVLGPTKTAGAEGVHHLAPGVLAALDRRHAAQVAEHVAAGDAWVTHTYQGRPVDLVFTLADGRLVNRQTLTKALQRAAIAAGVDPTGIATHTGRRTVVTALYGSEGVDLADVARHVGHSSTATTAGYVRNLGQRPKSTAEAAARALDAG